MIILEGYFIWMRLILVLGMWLRVFEDHKEILRS